MLVLAPATAPLSTTRANIASIIGIGRKGLILSDWSMPALFPTTAPPTTRRANIESTIRIGRKGLTGQRGSTNGEIHRKICSKYQQNHHTDPRRPQDKEKEMKNQGKHR
jgi:hypothetical protein